MSSWQAHATDMYARFWLKRRLAGKKDLARARAILSGGALPIPPGAAFRRAAVSSVSGEWVTPAGSATGPVLLYLHGGGYFTGCARAHRPITASFATAGFNVFVPEYRLAPEYPYPRPSMTSKGYGTAFSNRAIPPARSPFRATPREAASPWR